MAEQEYIPQDPPPPLTDAYLHRDIHPDEKAQHGQAAYDSVLHTKDVSHNPGCEDKCEYWKYT